MQFYRLVIFLALFNFAHGQNKVSSNFSWKNDILRLQEFLSIPNDANHPDHIKQNIHWLHNEFQELAFDVEILEIEGLDLFFAENIIDKNLPTVLFYMHFDGQPVDQSKWIQDDPYLPVIKSHKNPDFRKDTHINMLSKDSIYENDLRIYARSSSDDKGPIVMFISALKHLKNLNQKSKYNIKVILDGQEEKGSPTMKSAVRNYKTKLMSDYLVVLDGPMHDSGLPTVIYGIRGISTIDMEVFGMARPQHSGHFGNYGPNPIFRAAEIIESLKDSMGRVRIPGFYDGIEFDSSSKKLMAEVPDDPEVIRKRAGFSVPDRVGNSYQESMQYPSLNISGINSGWIGESSRTIVPDKTILKLDIRTVIESNPDTLIEKLKNHIKSLGYTILKNRPSEEEMLNIDKPIYFKSQHLMFPFRTDTQSQISTWIKKALHKNSNKRIVQIRTTGGSVPISYFISELNIPTIILPLVNADNNQHSPNENLKLSYFIEGIATIKNILKTAFIEK